MTEAPVSPSALSDYLLHWEAASPNRMFITDDAGARLTYAEAATQVRTLSTEFRRRGLVAGQRVAVLAENSAAWIIAFLAALASGMVAVPLATRVTTEELDVLLLHAEPGAIAVDNALRALVGARWSDRLVLLSKSFPPSDQHVTQLAVCDAPACMIYTSGTTNRPKGVLLSNTALARAAETYAALFHSTPEMHTIVAVPLSQV